MPALAPRLANLLLTARRAHIKSHAGAPRAPALRRHATSMQRRRPVGHALLRQATRAVSIEAIRRPLPRAHAGRASLAIAVATSPRLACRQRMRRRQRPGRPVVGHRSVRIEDPPPLRSAPRAALSASFLRTPTPQATHLTDRNTPPRRSSLGLWAGTRSRARAHQHGRMASVYLATVYPAATHHRRSPSILGQKRQSHENE